MWWRQPEARYSLGTQMASFRGSLMPPPLSLCLPEELTEFEVVRGGRESSGLCNSTLRIIDPSAKLSLPLQAATRTAHWTGARQMWGNATPATRPPGTRDTLGTETAACVATHIRGTYRVRTYAVLARGKARTSPRMVTTR